MASSDFPCSLDLSVPFPSARLATIALQTLQVDKELSPLVQRHISLASSPEPGPGPEPQHSLEEPAHVGSDDSPDSPRPATLEVRYRAATNRMLRVAVNSFLDSLGLAVEVMQYLDEDVLPAEPDAPAAQAVPAQ
ncbi:hypothetical protein ESCO_004871 [Escovopsis weberi]|uniref:EKC/KEOPS complex subunit LAGE3 n=1 Tax=Escovopsis weberi TaxID=150374 RepID=A0A0M8MPW4_ESCWE|nr:hypothetical protein ESCO_004871 [Escovopsis weberi]